MRRIRCDVNGGPDVLFAEDVPAPEPGPGEVLVRTEAIGITLPSVRKAREGSQPAPLGGEVAGTVAALGADVTGFAPGDRVTGLCFGHAYAEYALVQRAMASAVPDWASAVEAVALIRAGLVARGAYQAGRPDPGSSVLVTAAASAIGFQIAAIARGKPEEYARWRGELWDRFRAGQLRVPVHAQLPLAEAARAHEIIESRRNLGKVVLVTG